MKKSTKLIIGLTFLAATATAASVAIAVTTITRKTPKKQLSKQIKIFEEELETNKELKEFQKAEIKLALEAAQAVLSNPESSDEQIKNALDVLVKKVEEIKAQTEEPETPEQQLAKAKAAYDAKVKEAEELVAHLADEKYKEIKKTLEEEVATAKNDVPADNPTKENYKSATEKLTAAITKATEAKKAIDQEAAQSLIIDKVKQKTILTGEVDEKTKSEILKLSETKIKESPKDKKCFGSLKIDKKNKTFTFGSSGKKAKTEFSGVSFAQEFLDMVANKEIVFPFPASNNRLALCFEKKEDGKIVIPFRFKDKVEVHEIELF